MEYSDNIKAVEDILGYSFKNKNLIATALSHPSLDGQENYQRLEFLGDRVLGLVISTWVFDLFPDAKEGELNQRFSALVCGKTLASMADNLGFGPYIVMTESAKNEATDQKMSVLADIMESLIGALYLDSDFATVESLIKKHWAEAIKTNIQPEKDAKTKLQEWAQANKFDLPVYTEISRSGLDHNPTFTIQVSVGDAHKAEATGQSKREAEQSAAEMLMTTLEGSV